jgi:hypothetical protein
VVLENLFGFNTDLRIANELWRIGYKKAEGRGKKESFCQKLELFSKTFPPKGRGFYP